MLKTGHGVALTKEKEIAITEMCENSPAANARLELKQRARDSSKSQTSSQENVAQIQQKTIQALVVLKLDPAINAFISNPKDRIVTIGPAGSFDPKQFTSELRKKNKYDERMIAAIEQLMTVLMKDNVNNGLNAQLKNFILPYRNENNQIVFDIYIPKESYVKNSDLIADMVRGISRARVLETAEKDKLSGLDINIKASQNTISSLEAIKQKVVGEAAESIQTAIDNEKKNLVILQKKSSPAQTSKK